jgi:hypothetical protein
MAHPTRNFETQEVSVDGKWPVSLLIRPFMQTDVQRYKDKFHKKPAI